MIKKTPAEIGHEIAAHFPCFNVKPKHKGAFEDRGSGVASFQGDSKRFHDFCQIGALLTDEAQCMKHLSDLSARLAGRLVGGLSRGTIPGGSARLTGLGRMPHRITADEEKTLGPMKDWRTANPPKFYGVLKDTLFDDEKRWGFNVATKESGDVAVLSGFVHPTSFNDILLKQARHWKDPGASIAHGEYTHRLQWWIICREHETGGPYRLKAEPAERFKVLPKYVTAYWQEEQLRRQGVKVGMQLPESLGATFTNRSMWDFLCDAVPLNDSMAGTTPASDSFRSPQYMNLFLTGPGITSRFPRAGMLHAYLVARYNKRTWQYANNLLRPYKDVLARKWGISDEQFDQMFQNESQYGKLDIMATVDGQIVVRPQPH